MTEALLSPIIRFHSERITGYESRMDLLAELQADPAGGWDRFVREHSPTVLAAIHRLVNDADDRMDAYLFVMESLASDNARRLLAYGKGSKGISCSFSTWLKLLCRNLTIDWIRSQQGRRVMPRSITSLPPLSRKIFESVYWEGLSHAETVETLSAREGRELTLGELGKHLREIESRLSRVYRTNLSHDNLYRRSRPLSFDDEETRYRIEGQADLPSASVSPERWTELAEIRDRYRRALRRLSPEDSTIAQLRFEKEMTAREIADRIGLDDYKSVYARILRITEVLRKEMQRGNSR